MSRRCYSLFVDPGKEVFEREFDEEGVVGKVHERKGRQVWKEGKTNINTRSWAKPQHQPRLFAAPSLGQTAIAAEELRLWTVMRLIMR